MQMCEPHWNDLRAEVDRVGLCKFVAKSGEEIGKKLEHEIKTGEKVFDPLMSAFLAIVSNAVQMGGMYMLSGDFCPICESIAHGGPPAEWWFSESVGEQLKKAKELNLI